ncbi:MAG TPA: hypothetical protein VHL80_03605 [Polyangia bacterium]|nr:hypothetical protein [Polyangia bacterium]
MTLRGYSATVDGADLPPSAAGTRARADGGRGRPSPSRESQTRQEWLSGKQLPPRPSTLAARQALAGVTKAAAGLEQQLDLIEMLIAVGPEVREQGTFQEALRGLEGVESELGRCVAALIKACGDLRGGGALTLGDRR